MDVNDNLKKGEYNRVILVDPNQLEGDVDRKMVPLEDLSIDVELIAVKRARTIIVANSEKGEYRVDNAGDGGFKVNFIQGSEKPSNTKTDKRYSLTTNYTDINYSLSRSGENSEALGITNIDIDFNSSYTPLIKINMIDVRGGSVFSAGMNSKYNVFFSMPYPIFHLKIKGFYGGIVEYCLHLVKFTSKFNSSTGNFEIMCEFIGYTYAFLADMLIGYLRGVTETEEGIVLLANYKDNIKGDNSHIIPIDEFIKKIPIISSKFKNIARSNAVIKETRENSDTNSGYDELLDLYDKLITYLNETFRPNFKEEDGLIIFNHSYDETLSTNAIKDYNNAVGEKVKEINTYTKNEDLKLNPEDRYFKLEPKHTNVHGLEGTELDETTTPKKSEAKRLAAGFNSREGLMIYDIRTDYNDLRAKKKLISEKLNKSKLDASKAISKYISEDLGFEPTIRKIVEMFTVHCEVLLQRIHDVAKAAESSEGRKKIINKYLKQLDVKQTNEEKIYPFPQFNDVSNNEAWLGTITDGENIEEVKFILDLLRGISKSAKVDAAYSVDSATGTSRKAWFPVNPLDNFISFANSPYSQTELNTNDSDFITRIAVRRGVTFIAYTNKVVTNDEIEKMAKLDAINCVSSLDKDRYDALNSGDAGTKAEDFIAKKTAVNYVPTAQNADFKTYMFVENGADNIDYIEITDFDHQLNTYRGYISLYGAGPNAAEDNRVLEGTAFFRPYSKFKVLKDHETLNSEIGNAAKNNLYFSMISLPVASDIYFDDMTQYSGDAKYRQANDGSIYVTILTEAEFKENKGVFDDEEFKKVVSDPNVVMEEDNLNSTSTDTWSPFGGDYKAQQFSKVKYYIGSDDDEFDTQYMFYSNEIHTFLNQAPEGFKTASGTYSGWENFTEYSNTSVRYNIKNKNDAPIYVSQIKYGVLSNDDYGKETCDVYLFGSPYYYLQGNDDNGNLAKAYLFLHCIPFEGMDSKKKFDFTEYDYKDDNETAHGILRRRNIRGLFSERGAFIHTPYAWILFLGSLIWRYNEQTKIGGSDPIKHTVNYGSSVIDLNTQLPVSDEHYLDNARTGLYYNKNEKPIYLTTSAEHDAGYTMTVGDEKKEDNAQRIPLERAIMALPITVKNLFVEQFTKWARGSFKTTLRPKLEIIKQSKQDTLTYIQWSAVFNAFYDAFHVKYDSKTPRKLLTETETIEVITSLDSSLQIFDINNIKEYTSPPVPVKGAKSEYHFGYSTRGEKSYGKHYNFVYKSIKDAPMKKQINSLQKDLIGFLTETRWIVNSTWRIWNYYNGNNADVKNKLLRNRLSLWSDNPITLSKAQLKTYLTAFFNKISQLSPKVADATASTSHSINDAINDDHIKLNIYRNIKAIYDKWVSGGDGKPWTICGDDKNKHIIDSFRFINRAYHDIGDKMLINPFSITNNIVGNMNQSFYDLLGRVLADNYMDFIPLPSYVNLRSAKDMAEMFKPYSYRKSSISSSPTFVCVYLGQRSAHLDVADSPYKNDGFNLTFDGSTKDNIPSDFQYDDKQGWIAPIPAFVVNYANENQSIFKDVSLDQQEFTETDEGLKIIDDIANNVGETNKSYIGQNLFNLYSVRSYSCEVECLGNAMIQPMMYFQLNNIPMFKGAYWIIKTSHHIEPNYMTTKFKGVRIKKVATPLLLAETVFMNFVGMLTAASTGAAGGAGFGSTTCPPGFHDNGTVKEAMGFFMSSTGLNLTKAQAAGILGNFLVESKLITNACNASCFYGIAQWDTDRRKRFSEVVKAGGVDYGPFSTTKTIYESTFTEQLKYVEWELTKIPYYKNLALANLKTKTTPESAAESFQEYYEGAKGQGDQDRKDWAKKVYDDPDLDLTSIQDIFPPSLICGSH